MKNSLKSAKSGFTIIEVMIVLAIAGLIMVIVFLAVPALQRSSRNTQRSSDASNLLSAANEWSSNHNSKAPSDSAAQTDIPANVKLGYYSAATLGTSDVSDADVLNWAVGLKCKPDGDGSTTGTARSVVVLFAIETSSGTQVRCIGS
jgi:prepilin-type N-terminal cleavage/methylation domain-containing protein